MGDGGCMMGIGGCVVRDGRCVMGDGGCVMGDGGCVMGDGGCVMGDGGCVKGDGGCVMRDGGCVMGDGGMYEQCRKGGYQRILVHCVVPEGLTISVFFLQIVHASVHDEIVERLKKAYSQVKIGDPLEGTRCATCTLDI